MIPKSRLEMYTEPKKSICLIRALYFQIEIRGSLVSGGKINRLSGVKPITVELSLN